MTNGDGTLPHAMNDVIELNEDNEAVVLSSWATPVCHSEDEEIDVTEIAKSWNDIKDKVVW